MSVSDWARQIGILPSTITKRIDAGWSVEQALTIKRRWTHPIKPQAQADHEMREAVRRFACEQRRAIDAFEEDMLDRLKGVAMTPPGEGRELSETLS
ncbi:hypothetical protein [Bradyrhizobium sp. AZCC 1610]|uniref:hypothetical protein n=1 Tax=Bradyrhizobium sp. AZCC 1610 TaxID=3117020 RepID=UPI002FF06B84